MSESEELQRELGLFSATAIGLGTMIGGGIFILPSVAAAQAGPASIVSFALAGGISLLAALSHAELAADKPVDGGGYEYVDRAFGDLLGSVVGWGMWIGLIFATAFYAVGFAQYLAFFFDRIPIPTVAIVLTAVLVGLNCYGISEAGWLQNLVVVLLLSTISLYVLMGIPHVDAQTLTPVAPSGTEAVIATTGTVYVALIGFSLIATAAGEIKRPTRNIPLSMIAAVVVPTVLYVGVMVVSTGVVPSEELAESTLPITDVATVYWGEMGALVMTMGALLATVSSANVSILSAGRVSFAMSRGRILTSWFRRTHESFGTPHRAILATGIAVGVVIVPQVGIAILAEIASFMFLITYALVHAAIVWLRRYGENYTPTFRIPDPLFPAVPVAGILAISGVIVTMNPVVVWGGVVLSVAAVAWYFVYVEAGTPDAMA